jgi:hypothetical protein
MEPHIQEASKAVPLFQQFGSYPELICVCEFIHKIAKPQSLQRFPPLMIHAELQVAHL